MKEVNKALLIVKIYKLHYIVFTEMYYSIN